LIKNGKYFVAPEGDGGDFKALFMRLASSGAGRPVDASGFPQGPWTPDLLAEAISRIDTNPSGIELRTVQLWFQDNDKGISSDNIRWLARVFGCDDPEATGDWQAALSASQSRLVAKRRQDRQTTGESAQETHTPDSLATRDVAALGDFEGQSRRRSDEMVRGFNLALRSEAFVGRRSPLDLPASVFAGAVALGFFSYFLGIHSVAYERDDGIAKQVGFLWAPNWTFLFMVFMPLYFAFAGDLLVFWKTEGRGKVLAAMDSAEGEEGWSHKVEASAYTYWTVLLICIGFAGLFQWISVRLMPLLQGGGRYAIDWGSLAIALPELYSTQQDVAFTAFAYLYMCLCFYFFFVVLILLYTVSHDLWEVEYRSPDEHAEPHSYVEWVRGRIMRGIFRCTVCGLLIAICMKLQSVYLTTNAESIPDWLFREALSALSGRRVEDDRANYSSPTHYTSLLIALAATVPFLHAIIRTGLGHRLGAPSGKMVVAITLLGAVYLLIGAFIGFSLLLGVSVLLATYGLFDPAFGLRTARKAKDDLDVL
jgi:hypothetical protein